MAWWFGRLTRIPEDQSLGAEGESRNLFWRRGAHPLRSSRGAHMGRERRHAHRPDDWRPPFLWGLGHESDFGGHRTRPPAVHDHRQGQRQRRCLHRIPETPDQGRRARDFSHYRSRPRATKISAFVQTLGGKLRLFFLPPYSPDRNPDELVWKHLKADTVGRMAVTSQGRFRKQGSPLDARSAMQHGKTYLLFSNAVTQIRGVNMNILTDGLIVLQRLQQFPGKTEGDRFTPAKENSQK